MNWLTLKSNSTIWHVNMDIVETVKVEHRQDTAPEDPRIQTISFFFKNDDEPSLQFSDEEDQIELVAKALQDYMSKNKKA